MKNTYTGKDVLKNGIWYPVTVEAESINKANKMVNSKNHSGQSLRGRFYKHSY